MQIVVTILETFMDAVVLIAAFFSFYVAHYFHQGRNGTLQNIMMLLFVFLAFDYAFVAINWLLTDYEIIHIHRCTEKIVHGVFVLLQMIQLWRLYKYFVTHDS